MGDWCAHWKEKCIDLEAHLVEKDAEIERVKETIQSCADYCRDCPQLAKKDARIAELETALNEIEEREAACCPEDVGFEEYMASLRNRIAELETALEKAHELSEYAAAVKWSDKETNTSEYLEGLKELILKVQKNHRALDKNSDKTDVNPDAAKG